MCWSNMGTAWQMRQAFLSFRTLHTAILSATNMGLRLHYLDVDLRKWAPKAGGDDKGYGNYRFRYMLRLSAMLQKLS